MKIKNFDVVDFLDSDEAIIEYLNAALEEGEPDFFVKAVGDVARAKGMIKVARSSGLGRQNLYQSLSRGGNSRISKHGVRSHNAHTCQELDNVL